MKLNKRFYIFHKKCPICNKEFDFKPDALGEWLARLYSINEMLCSDCTIKAQEDQKEKEVKV